MPVVLVAALPELFPAIALLLLAWAALILLRKPLVELLSRIPAIGGQVAQAVGDGISSVVNWALGWAATALYALVQLVYVPVRSVNAALSAGVTALEAIASFLAAIPGAVNAVYAWATPRLAVLAADAAHLASRITSALATAATAARAIATELVAAAVALLRGELALAVSHLEAALAAAVGAAATATAQLAARLTATEAALSAAITAEATNLRGIIGQDVAGLQAEVGQVGALVAPLAAAGLIARMATLEATVATTIEECVTPTCSVIGPQVGTLQALSTLAILGVVGGLVAEAVRDPQGTAHLVAAGVGDVHDAAAGLAEAFLGVPL